MVSIFFTANQRKQSDISVNAQNLQNLSSSPEQTERDVGASQLGEQDLSSTAEPRQPHSSVGRGAGAPQRGVRASQGGIRVPEMIVEWEQRLATSPQPELPGPRVPSLNSQGPGSLAWTPRALGP